MINKKIFFSLLLLAAGFLSAAAQKSPQDMDRFIDALMKKMTVEEKIGQLNLPVTGEITTGQAKSSDIAAKIKRGEVGGLFNLKGVEKIRDVQKQAVEQSRLGLRMQRRPLWNVRRQELPKEPGCSGCVSTWVLNLKRRSRSVMQTTI